MPGCGGAVADAPKTLVQSFKILWFCRGCERKSQVQAVSAQRLSPCRLSGTLFQLPASAHLEGETVKGPRCSQRALATSSVPTGGAVPGILSLQELTLWTKGAIIPRLRQVLPRPVA